MNRYIFNEPVLEPIQDKDEIIPEKLLLPHYSDSYFSDRNLGVYLDPGYTTSPNPYGGTDEVQEAKYFYNDRLPVDYDKLHRVAEEVERELGTKSTARYFENMLQSALEEPELQLVHLITGVNRGNGFPYHVYGLLGGQVSIDETKQQV